MHAILRRYRQRTETDNNSRTAFAQISYQAGGHFSLIMSEKQNKKGLTMCNGPKKWGINFNNDGDISFEENYLIYENGVFMY